MTRDDLRHEARAVALWREAAVRGLRMHRRQKAGLALALAAYAGLVLNRISTLFDHAARALDAAQGGTMHNQNQTLLYGLRRAIAAVEASDKEGIVISSVRITDAEASLTVGGLASEQRPPELPPFIPQATRGGLL